jgi:hypothetical protein
MWVYKDKEILSHADLHENCTDLVYCITYESGKKYIGKKTVRALRRVKPTKKQLAIRKNFKRVEVKNIPFQNYEGSSEETSGQVIVTKEILYQCSNKKTATYIEVALLFEEDAIFSNVYLNKNISGTFYDNSLDGLIEELGQQND